MNTRPVGRRAPSIEQEKSAEKKKVQFENNRQQRRVIIDQDRIGRDQNIG